MKKIEKYLLVFASTFLFVFASSAQAKLSFPATALTENLTLGLSFMDADTRPIEGALASITLQELKDNIYLLASDEYKGRGSGYPGDDLAAAYISEKFEEYGIIPAYTDGYLQKFNISSGRGYTWNVVGYLPGRDPELADEYVVVGAHYDHLGERYGKIYYGADDNASGTAAIIEIAEACSEIQAQLKRTVVFIGFSAEEKGLIGSKYFVNNSFYNIKDTIYMVNLDMVGYMESYGSLKFLGGSSTNYMKDLINTVTARYPDVNPSVSSSSGGGSDHAPFISKGIPAVFLHTGLHSNYHQPTDTADKIDYEGAQFSTMIAFELVWNLASQEGKPQLNEPLLTFETGWNHDHGVTPFEVPFK